MKKSTTLTIEQKESAKHGEPIFPIQKYITRLASDYPIISTHWHEEAEFTYIIQGSCTYQIDFVEYTVAAGDCIFIPPLLLHTIKILGSEEFYSETYVFHMKYLGGNSTDISSTKYLTPIMNHELILPCHFTKEHSSYEDLLSCFTQIQSQYQNKPIGFEIAIKAALLQTIFILLQNSTKNTSTLSHSASEKLKLVIDYIELHYSEQISIAELAKLCYFSEYHFMRFFKRYMGMTCMEYINNLRLEKAVTLFEEGTASILNVSLAVGFHNLSYFHRAFKKKYGMTPHSFIKQL